MRVLGIGQCNDLAAMYAGMQSRGHEVRVFVQNADCHSVFAGLLTRTNEWQKELGWVRAAGTQGMIVFETASQGTVQDELRAQGFQVVGGSALGDRLESDREFGQAAFRQAGLPTARSHSFNSYAQAVDFLSARTKRFVLKFNGADAPRTRNYIAQKPDSGDLVALLRFYGEQGAGALPADFVLMEYLEGIEIGVGGYFNGESFLETACIDFEHKRFFPGDLGELTGEMGTVVSYENSAPLREQVLKPLTELLREGGYCGYININLIANAEGLWPLEFTSRFGYPGYAICERLHGESWERIFLKLLHRSDTAFGTLGGFSVGIVVTVPPFPYSQGYDQISRGLLVNLDEGLSPEEHAAIAFAEVEMQQGALVTSGTCGYLGVVTGRAATVDAARLEALAVVRKIYVPNLRYRNDIGSRATNEHLNLLRQWGYL